jgi:hypothetical protein
MKITYYSTIHITRWLMHHTDSSPRRTDTGLRTSEAGKKRKKAALAAGKESEEERRRMEE